MENTASKPPYRAADKPVQPALLYWARGPQLSRGAGQSQRQSAEF